MARYSAVILALIIGSQAFYNLGITIYWLSNHAYIATVLCENKDKPQLHCDGKCYLKKKITEIPPNLPASTAPKTPSFKKGLDLAEFLVVDNSPALASLSGNASSQQPAGTSRHHGVNPAVDIFHPPPVA